MAKKATNHRFETCEQPPDPETVIKILFGVSSSRELAQAIAKNQGGKFDSVYRRDKP